ncbi:FtsQ-type POTRA domain-containing protein [Rhodospirillales bacterium]|jgi:cell division protein FtsQ|nr:FtsQ-type POTRA domain-containing protein [Rhodospirillales bacterium]
MMFARKKKQKSQGVAPRPRVRPMWRRAWVAPLVAGVVMGSFAGGSWWAYSSGNAAKGIEKVRWSAISATATMGFRVNEVMVSGRQQTEREILVKALNVARGAPILAFDIADAKRRVEALPWVRASTIERMLPDTILISIVEREPLALWQLDSKLHLIDAEGEVILNDGLENYSDLLMVVGNGAETEASALIALIGTEPALMQQVKAATWIGSRRWNVHLKGDIVVRLPEDDAQSAWTRLAEYHKNHRVLDKNVTVLDLRIPDRLIVKTGPKGSGQET